MTTLLITFISIKRKTITVTINSKATRFVTYKSTVSEALSAKGISINSKDYVSPALNSKLTEGESISVKKAVNVAVAVDGKDLAVMSSQDNIGLMLKQEGIVLNGSDRVTPAENTPLSEGLKVEVIRVETKTLSESKPVAFKEIVKTNKKLANTKRRTLQEGKAGEMKVTYSVVYENGSEVSRTPIKETVVRRSTDRIIEQGSYPLMPVSRSGSLLPYSRVTTVRSTAYWAVSGVGKTYTASGRKAVRNPDGYSTIAVDPSIFPYGTKLFIEGYGFAIAADTGSSIVGNKIDVFFDTYKEACSYGVKYVKIYRLN